MAAISQRVRADDERLTWQGTITLQWAEDWVMTWRVPYAERALFPPVELRRHAAMLAGARIAFLSDTDRVAGTIIPDPEAARLDLYCDGVLHGSVALS